MFSSFFSLVSGEISVPEENRGPRYITKISHRYQPYYYPNGKTLNKVLKGKIIINQTDQILTETQVEVLSLGLNFIFAKEQRKEKTTLDKDAR